MYLPQGPRGESVPDHHASTFPASTTGGRDVVAAAVRGLAELLCSASLTEIEVEDGRRRIRVVRRAQAGIPIAASAALPAVRAEPTPPVPVRSIVVGTARLRDVIVPGRSVTGGETLLAVEMLGALHPVAAPPGGGVVRAILVEDGQPVEYDQPLVLLEA